MEVFICLTLLIFWTGRLKATSNGECCSAQKVGDFTYSLLNDDVDRDFPEDCLNKCAYTRDGEDDGPDFCFKPGDLQSTCVPKKNEVSCGYHVASACDKCPNGNGAAWCNGQCAWKDGRCVEKKGGGCSKRSGGYYPRHNNINNGRLTDATTAQECADRCFKNPQCKFWSFGRYRRQPDWVCYLKKADEDWIKDETWQSGNKACGEDAKEIVIQKRVHGARAFSFQKNFIDYENGFSNFLGEKWVGLKYQHKITNDAAYGLKVSLEDWDGKIYRAYYNTFKVGGSPNYELEISGFDKTRSTLGDSMTSGTIESTNNGHAFRTKDKDTGSGTISVAECSKTSGSGGWWYSHDCGKSAPNGINPSKQADGSIEYIFWENGGERKNTTDTWKSSKFTLIKK